MGKFLLRDINYSNISKELDNIGFDIAYKEKISDKFRYCNIKIYDLTLAQANILKQTALMFGADCAVHKEVITGNVNKSDVILCGSYSQLIKITDKLKKQPFSLKQLSDDILLHLSTQKRKTQIVGILNLTPDSFSDGGMYNKPEFAKEKLLSLIEDGADAIDIGAESTRPNSQPVSNEEQIARLQPIIKFITNENIQIPISVDTRSSIVAEFVLDSGIKIINDVSGFDYDKNMMRIIAKYKASAIIQHSLGSSADTPFYNNVVDTVFRSLNHKLINAREFGIKDIILDPGIGFGKTREDNLILLDNIVAFKSLDCPIMVGLSRKRVLGLESQISNEIKDYYTLIYSYPLIRSGVDYLRVHNVKMHKLFLNTIPT